MLKLHQFKIWCNRLSVSQRGRLTFISLFTLCALIVGAGLWGSKTVQTSQAAQKENSAKQSLHEQIRAGLGHQTRFPAEGDSHEQVSASVESVANFVYERSGLRMSDETKKKLVEVEQDILSGKANRISVEELTRTVTETASDRLKIMTNKEIEETAQIYLTPKGEILTRAGGKLGVLSKDEFVAQLKAGRNWSKTGDAALKEALRPMVEGEVEDRLTNLGEALPDQFRQAQSRGVTPLQALVISYSVVADDPLAFSKSDLAQQRIKQRIFARQTRAERKAQKPQSGRPYGVNGYIYSSPVHLLINKEAVGKLVDRAKGGKSK